MPSAEAAAVTQVRQHLDNPLRVGLTDGRVIVGKFVCLDKQRNILLVEAQESRLVRGVVDLMSAPCRPAQTPLDSTH